MLSAAESINGPADLLSLLPGLGATGLLALGVTAFWKGWIVRGSEYQSLKKERDDLQAAVLEKVIPAITEANLTMRLLQTKGRE